jgi:hypothetical protein
MNQWPIYSFIKVVVLETGKLPTYYDISAQFPYASIWAKDEGILEFLLAYCNDSSLNKCKMDDLDMLVRKLQESDPHFAKTFRRKTAYTKLLSGNTFHSIQT